jgi:hypothetical protein
MLPVLSQPVLERNERQRRTLMTFRLRLMALAGLLTLLALAVASCIAPWDFPNHMFNPGFPFGGFGFFGFPFAVLGLGVYFLPTIIAAARRARGLVGIILLNLFAGWTGIGWVIALIWSLVGVSDRK